MSLLRKIGDVLQTKSTARRGAPVRCRSLRLESLEQRELLTAVVDSFAGLQYAIEHGEDSDIELGANIEVAGAGDTIAVTGGNFTINGNGHSITTSASSRSASLFSVSGGALTVSGVTISGFNYSSGDGAVFNQTGGTITVGSGTTIEYCSAANGGVAYVYEGTFTVGAEADPNTTVDNTAVIFRGDHAENGGVVYAYDSSVITINCGTFNSNYANDEGGVAYSYYSTVTINDGVFNSNYADSGGVIRLYGYCSSYDSTYDGGKVDIKGGTFQSNHAKSYGGVVSAEGGIVTVSGGQIGGTTEQSGEIAGANFARYGGVIYTNQYDTVVTISGGTISGNKATGSSLSNGGVIYAETARSITIDGSTTKITKNHADRDGGVIYANLVETISIKDGTIENNFAYGNEYSSGGGGGVIYATGWTYDYYSTEVTISGGTISGNQVIDPNSGSGSSNETSSRGGGVVYLRYAGNLTISGSTTVISGNEGKYGGVVYANGASSITISGGKIGETANGTAAGNSATRGGVVYASNVSNITIETKTIDGVTTTPIISNNFAAEGGVVFTKQGTFKITGGEIRNNTATGDGGVACVDTGDFEISGSATVISGNKGSRGGVVYTNQESYSSVTIKGGTISDNQSTGVGGGVAFINAGSLTISGGDISGNKATYTSSKYGAGGVVYSRGDVTITGGTLWGNSARAGGVVYIVNGDSDVTIDDGIFGKAVTVGGTTEYVGNTAVSGGVVCVNEGNIYISGGTFQYNRATGNGGVIHADSGDIEISSGTFKENSADGNGGVVFGGGVVRYGVSQRHTEVEVTGGTYKGNHAANGGVFYSTAASKVTVNDGTFGAEATSQNPQSDGNYAAKGGVFFVHGATANIYGGTFNGNAASASGGAVYVTNFDGEIYNYYDSTGPTCNAVVNIDSGSFANNTAASYGGALYAVYYNQTAASASTDTTVTVNLAEVTMENNSAHNGGAIANNGAMVTDIGSTGAVKTFTGNSAFGNGGAIFNSGEVTLTNALFSENYSVGNGGAVDNLATGTLTLTNATFEDNSALADAVSVSQVNWAGLALNAGDGGAIQNWGEATLTNAYFTGNSAHDGGAIANGAGAFLTLNQTVNDEQLGFSGNGAVYGGAIINVGTLQREANQSEDLVFTGNLAYNNGGAISNSDNNGQVTAGSLLLFNATFTNNTAGSTANTGSGGAIISAKELTISDSTFADNNAKAGGKGGAIDHTAGDLSLDTVTFSGNSASNTGFGGAVNTWAGAEIIDCTFSNNNAKYGGAVSVLGNDVTTKITYNTDSTSTGFTGNSAVSYGGAIYASGTVEIDGADITGNTASLGGGVMAISSNLTYASDDDPVAEKGRGKVIFTGDQTTFSDNNATKSANGKHVGSDICASSSNSAAGDGAVIEIVTMPEFSDSTDYVLAIDRSILVVPDSDTVPDVEIYSNKGFVCSYNYDESTSTLEFTWLAPLTSSSTQSEISRWEIYWGGSAPGPHGEYPGTGGLPSGKVTDGTAVLIKGFGNNYEMNYYLFPAEYPLIGTGGGMTSEDASEALFNDALFDDSDVFEGLASGSSALEDYCDEYFL